MFHLTIRRRLLLATCLMTLAMFVLGGWSVLASQRASASTSALVASTAAAAHKVAQLREAIWRMVGVEAKIIAVGSNDTGAVEKLWDEWKAHAKAARQLSLEIGQLDAGSTELANLVANQDKRLAEYIAAVDPIITKLHDVELDGFGALGLSQAAQPKTAALLASIDDILQGNERHEAAVRDAVARAASIDALMGLPVIAGSLALLLPLMLLTIRSVCRPIDQAVSAAGRIAGGDLSEQLDTRGRDEMGRLLGSLQHMQDALRTLVGRVRDSAQSIQTASHEVASGNQDLSERTETTASHLQHSASSVHELSGTVSSTADSARQATVLAQSASDVAKRGGSVVSDVVATMNDINSSSKKITEIINVIDGIAFQTNILALNAAVEAARAGEQGRGFAVVASEVRSLAQRSAGAAREIKVLIGASVDRVEHGVRLVHDAGSTMQEIVSSVQRVTDIISEISHAADEQRAGIGQVSEMVSQLDQATQQNAALVEQSAAAAQSLNQQSDALTGLVATFRLGTVPPALPPGDRSTDGA